MPDGSAWAGGPFIHINAHEHAKFAGISATVTAGLATDTDNLSIELGRIKF